MCVCVCVCQVSLNVVKEAVGNLEEVHFVLFGMPAFNAYVDHVSIEACMQHVYTREFLYVCMRVCSDTPAFNAYVDHVSVAPLPPATTTTTTHTHAD